MSELRAKIETQIAKCEKIASESHGDHEEEDAHGRIWDCGIRIDTLEWVKILLDAHEAQIKANAEFDAEIKAKAITEATCNLIRDDLDAQFRRDWGKRMAQIEAVRKVIVRCLNVQSDESDCVIEGDLKAILAMPLFAEPKGKV